MMDNGLTLAGNFTSEKPKSDVVAAEILDEMDFVTDRLSEDIFQFTDGVYQRTTENVITDWVVDHYPRESRHFGAEVLHKIRAMTHHDPADFDGDLDIIAVKNGLLNITTRELQPFNPEYIATVRIPVEFDRGAGCTRWTTFMSEVVTPENAEILQEYVGYTLLRTYEFHNWLMLVGGGRNGKTTFINVVIDFLGENNISTCTLQDIEGNRFRAATLHSKLANVSDDISKLSLKETGLIKTLTGSGHVQVENKYGNPFDLHNRAKLLFATNDPPLVFDDTDAFFERLIVIPFPNQFLGGAQNTRLFDELTTPGELSGILNWALDGLDRLRKNNAFSKAGSADETRNYYTRLSDPLAAFVQDNIEVGPEADIGKDEFYNRFLEFQNVKHLRRISKMEVGKRLPKIIAVGERYCRERGRLWTGVRWRSEKEKRDELSDKGKVVLEKFEKTDEVEADKCKEYLED